jgi:hypothetical protein
MGLSSTISQFPTESGKVLRGGDDTGVSDRENP